MDVNALVEIAVLAARALVAVILLASGFAKLADHRTFSSTLSQLFNQHVLVATISRAFPILEISLGFALLSGVYTRTVEVLVLILLLALATLSIITMVKGIDVPCRCFGALTKSRLGASSFYKASVLCLLVLLGMTFPSATLEHVRHLEGSLIILAALPVGLAFGAAAVAAQQLEEMRMLSSRTPDGHDD